MRIFIQIQRNCWILLFIFLSCFLGCIFLYICNFYRVKYSGKRQSCEEIKLVINVKWRYSQRIHTRYHYRLRRKTQENPFKTKHHRKRTPCPLLRLHNQHVRLRRIQRRTLLPDKRSR